MRWIVVAVLVVASASAMNLGKNSDPCDRKECRAGRECIVSGGVAQCLCVTSCPDHDKPVCGDDGESYDNYCLLHQKACLTGNPISVDYKGYCKRDIELALKEFGITTTRRPTTTSTTTAAPAEEELSVCYGPQRDALRDTVISHWQETVAAQPWYIKDMTYSESLSGHFFACDKDRDYKLRPDELIQCFSTMPFLPRPEQDLTVTRTLCVDAILEDADSDKDWKLDFKEFTHMLDPLYHPQAKNCSLEGKDYTDGAEVRVACNHCVCATGNWVCAAHNCPTEKETTANSLADDDFGYMDTKYDLDTDKKEDESDEKYYDDDDYEDDDSEELSEKKYTAEEAKKEYNSLSAVEQKKLTHLEENIKQFYKDVDRWNKSKSQSQKTTELLNSVSEEYEDDDDYSDEDDLSSEEEDELTSEEEEEEEEEDELLDQYEDLLTKSRKVRERLTALRTQINTLEEKRTAHRNQHHDDAHYYSYSHSDHTTSTTTESTAHLNTIDHSNRRVAPATTQSRKYQKYEAYRARLNAKQDRNRVASQTDNDIWEDQWKAKIKKHHHTNNHL